MKNKILIINTPNLPKKKLLQSLFNKKKFEISFVYNDEKKIFENLGNSVALINLPRFLFSDKILDIGKNLKWIHIGGAGCEHFLTQKLIRSDITLTNGKIIQGPEVSDHAIALLLAITRNLNFHIKKEQINSRPIELYKKRVGVIGGGGIGMLICEKLRSFGCVVKVFNDHLIPLNSFIDEFELINFKKIKLRDLDVVICALPLTINTKKRFNASFFSKMKKNSIFINISRGKVVNTEDLVRFVKEKKFLGVGLDVSDPEPLPKNHYLMNAPNVIITPHVAGLSEKNRDRSYELLTENIQRFTSNHELINIVNKKMGY